MGKLFLKRSQATSNGGGTSTAVRGATSSSSSSSSNSNNSFRQRGRNRNNNQQQQQQRAKPVQGSEAVAVESQQVNAKTFKYPMEGFETWIEHSLLYTMIRESNIFPPEAVLKAINEEEYTQYFIIKEKQQQKQQNNQQKNINDDDDDDDNDDDDSNRDSFNSTKKTVEAEVSYAQLTALLALAGEEWSSTSEVPQTLCKAISKQIIKYANKHDLDRQQELKELLNPLIDYAKGRGRKQVSSFFSKFLFIFSGFVLYFYLTNLVHFFFNHSLTGNTDAPMVCCLDCVNDQSTRFLRYVHVYASCKLGCIK
jgi:hypothetical protein